MRSWIILSCFPLNPYDPPFIGFFFLSDRTPGSSSSKGSDDNNGNERLILLPPMLLLPNRKVGRKRERGKDDSIFTYVQSHAPTHTRVPRTHSNTEAQQRGRGRVEGVRISTNGSSRGLAIVWSRNRDARGMMHEVAWRRSKTRNVLRTTARNQLWLLATL